MKILNEIRVFFKNSGYGKLFLSFFPLLSSFVLADNVFSYDFWKSIIFFAVVALFQLSIQIFDDFLDWVLAKTHKRLELEKTGVRGYYKKCSHFYFEKKSPRTYFYAACLFSLVSISVLALLDFWMTPVTIFTLTVFGLINYHPKFNKIVSHIGTESLTALLCAPISMWLMFYVSTECITLQLAYISLIMFFLALSVNIIASFLNLKTDILTNKTTIPVILNNKINSVWLIFVFTLLPYFLVALGVYLKVLPPLSLISLLTLGHSVWLLYLIYIFEKAPHRIIKWHFLMGEDESKVANEQNNESWYTVRYNFARNIYITFIILFSISVMQCNNTGLFD